MIRSVLTDKDIRMIQKLKNLGLKPSEIADILENNCSTIKNELRKVS